MGTTISGDTGITFPDATTQSKAVSQTTPFAVTASATTGAQLNLPEGTNNGAHFVALKAPNTLSADTTFTLPAADGTTGQFLQTNGAGSLAFASVAPGGTTGQVQVNNAGAFGAVAEGTAGQVLTSGGAGVAPTFATPTPAGLVLISTQTVTSAANLSFTGIASTYTQLMLVVSNCTWTNDLIVQVGSGATPTWQTTNYYYNRFIAATSTTGSGVNGILFSGSNSPVGPVSAIFTRVQTAGSTGVAVMINGAGGTASSTALYSVSGYGYPSGAVTAIRLLDRLGSNITGTATLYGMSS